MDSYKKNLPKRNFAINKISPNGNGQKEPYFWGEKFYQKIFLKNVHGKPCPPYA